MSNLDLRWESSSSGERGGGGGVCDELFGVGSWGILLGSFSDSTLDDHDTNDLLNGKVLREGGLYNGEVHVVC